MSDLDAGRVDELLFEAHNLPFGTLKMGLLDEAVRLADTLRDTQLMFEARMELVSAAGFSGEAEKMLTAFAWCIAHFEAEPDRFLGQRDSLLWFFKNVLHSADEFPQISVEQTKELREQMARLYRRYGYNMRPVYHARLVFSNRIGDRRAAAEAYEQFTKVPRDAMADCIACEADDVVEYYELTGDLEGMVAAAEPALSGQLTCAEVPHRTLNYVLRPLALLDRYDEADAHQQKGYRLIRSNPAFLRHVALQMAYLVHRGRDRAAVNMFQRHLGWALATFQLRSQFMFYLAAERVLSRLAGRKPAYKLNLPQAFPLFDSSNEYELTTLIEWFEGNRRRLAKRFDARNGNDFFSTGMVERLMY